MKKYVYKITDKFENFYYGSTNNTNRRLVEHRSKNLKLDKNSLKIEILFHTEDYANIEESLIRKELENKNAKCMNMTECALGGASKLRYSEEMKIISSNSLKNRWKDKEQRKKLLEANHKGRLKNDVFEMSKKSHKLKNEKMPEWTMTCVKTGKVFGPYKGYEQATLETGMYRSTFMRNLKNKSKSKKFEFKYLNEVTHLVSI